MTRDHEVNGLQSLSSDTSSSEVEDSAGHIIPVDIFIESMKEQKQIL